MNNGITSEQSLKFVRKHYENFPVASFLIPGEIRKDIAIVYWFARTADDLADEGNADSEERLKSLNDFERELSSAINSKSNNIYFLLLNETIIKRNLTHQYFFDLLSAFKQDVIKNRYNNFAEILDYCKRSANPVGRIILEINNIRDEEANKLSDKICTALQLTNFYQDTKIDYKKGRIYYPLDELKELGITENMFELNENNVHISALVKQSVDRAQLFFEEGKKLLNYLTGRLRIEIKWTITGGEKILGKIRENNYNILSDRPQLSRLDYFGIFIKSIL